MTVRAFGVASWVRRGDPVDVPSVILDQDLGPGESEVLAAGLLRKDTLLVIDDGAARRAARLLGMRVVGTLGLVLAARSSGRISSARPILERLRCGGMYLSDRVLDRALREVGE